MSRCVQQHVLRHYSGLSSRGAPGHSLSAYRRFSTSALSVSLSTPLRTRSTHLDRFLTTAATLAATHITPSAVPSPPTTTTLTRPVASYQNGVATTTREVKVVSYYLSPLDLVGLSYPPTTLKFTRPACTLVPLAAPSTSTATATLTAAAFDVYGSYAIVFDYGAIVFFNATDAQQQSFLPNHLRTTTTTTAAAAAAAATASVPTSGTTSLRLKDDYTVIVDPLLTTTHRQPNLSSASPSASSSTTAHTTTTTTTTTVHPSSAPAALTCAFHTDSVHVSSLDIYSVRVIAQILAQTISMEYYEHKTSSMLAEFHALSLHMSNSGTLPPSLTASSSSNLIKLLAQNNTILTTILTHVRLLDRSEISWRYGQYDALWEGMRHEFSIAERYETLETKLRLLHENHPLFLEVLHHKQGHRMELIIIALIAIEVLLAVVFHSPIIGWVLEELGLAEKGKIRAYD